MPFFDLFLLFHKVTHKMWITLCTTSHSPSLIPLFISFFSVYKLIHFIHHEK